MIWKIIKTAMIRADIDSIHELAERTGINESTLAHGRRTNPRGFIMYEILQIDKIVGFTDEEWNLIRRTA